MKKLYITTPLYYVNAPPHIGHAYTTIAADIYARYLRDTGYLLTGTDEHGSKIEAVAKEAGLTPQEHSDKIAGKFRDLWKHLDVRYDDFIRTTEPRHEKVVQGVFSRLQARDDIYKGTYKGYYCVSDETYWTETEAPPDEKGRRLCPNPDCRKPLVLTEEESYFFRLSNYQQRLLNHYRAHPEFLQPKHRAAEILRFVEGGLRDLAVSRSKVAWGIKLPSDSNHVVYVWFDALLNYVTAAGYDPAKSFADQPARFKELWPADVHLVGKEIYRFHTVIWPAMLMALELPLPLKVFAHGWWTVEGQKMSKSKSNFIDPWEVTQEFGIDAFRYFLFREMPFGNDGDYSRQSFLKRYNADLANDLGNLISRVANMVDIYIGGELPGKPASNLPKTKELAALAEPIAKHMESLSFYDALNLIWSAVGNLNQYVNTESPWKWAEKDRERARVLLFDLVSSLRLIASWLTPFMPQTAAKIHSQIGVRQFPTPLTPEEVLTGPSGDKILKSPPLFPRK